MNNTNTTGTTGNTRSSTRRMAFSAPATTSSSSSSSQQSARSSRHVLNYMHRPPRIVPNYGKRQRSSAALPKSSISRVLLYDNVTQQQMLDVKMNYLGAEQRKSGRLMDMHRKSFIVRRLQKERQMAETALHVDHNSLLHNVPASHTASYTVDMADTDHDQGADNDETDESGRRSGQDGVYVIEHHVTPRSPNDNRFGRNGDQFSGRCEAFLPFVSHDRKRAITFSDGFSPLHSPSPGKNAGQRPSKTASTVVQSGVGVSSPAFPAIHNSGAEGLRKARKVVLRMDSDHNGLTHMVHTIPQYNGFLAGEEGGRERESGAGISLMEDERYVRLERVLVRVQPPNEGYMELSPSFHSPRQIIAFTPPTSLRSSASSLRQRRSITTTTTTYSTTNSSPSPPSPTPRLSSRPLSKPSTDRLEDL